jgi:hypothetical protein
MSKGPKQLPNCLKIAETSVVLNVFKGASSVTSALTLLPFLCVAKQESNSFENKKSFILVQIVNLFFDISSSIDKYIHE